MQIYERYPIIVWFGCKLVLDYAGWLEIDQRWKLYAEKVQREKFNVSIAEFFFNLETSWTIRIKQEIRALTDSYTIYLTIGPLLVMEQGILALINEYFKDWR